MWYHETKTIQSEYDEHMSEQEARRSNIGLRSELEEDELVETIGLDDEEWAWRKEFVGFDGDDEANLTELTELFETIADEFTRTFYEHLTSYDETTDVLERSDRSLEQLKETQAQYLRSLGANAYDTGADPGYGGDYFRQRAVVGKLHSMLEMPQKHYIGTYMLYHEVLITELFDRFLEDLEVEDTDTAAVTDRSMELRENILSVLRITNLDLQVAMDTYFESEAKSIWVDALNEMINPVIVIDEESEVLVFNDAIEDLLGISKQEAERMEMWEIFRTNETHGTKETVIESVLETGEPVRDLETQIENHRGETLDVNSASVPMYDENGDLQGAVGVFRDVTELREKERELSETRERVTNEVNSLARDQVTTSDELTETMDDLEERVTEQVEMANEMKEELREYSATMDDVAASAEEVAAAARESQRLARSGLETSSDAKDGMDAVVESVDELLATAEQLSDRTAEIDDIVDVINDIADQTNILALNANIEAAHAGDAGDGFAVVADEVQSLATETKNHTKEVRAQIEEVKRQADETVREAGETTDRVTEASENVEAAFESFEEIVSAVEEAADEVEAIAAANDKQADSVDTMVTMAESYAEHSEAALEAVETTRRVAETQAETAQQIQTRIGDFADEMD
ncbi:PAS domain S-box protein [Natrialba sp. INN-245]|nr:PAS domain S-box protein [Natrialba sp. INN-245]